MKKIAPNIVYILFFIFYSCNDTNENIVNNAGLLFPNTYKIAIDDYNYIDSADLKIYSINSDTIIDTLGNMPVFEWNDITPAMVTVAIFSEPIIVEGSQIINADKIIWQWHKGMHEKQVIKEGNNYLVIAFNDGKMVEEKNILYSTQPIPLESGLYFWAVWGWDASSKVVSFSSDQRCFAVQ